MLLLDEPSLGLAPAIVHGSSTRSQRFVLRGISVLLVEQRAQLTVAFADRTSLIANGVVRRTLTPADVHDTEAMVHAYLCEPRGRRLARCTDPRRRVRPGAVYALMAVGIGLVLRVLRLVNFAYGQLIMAGAYTLAFTSQDGWPTWAGILMCFSS